MIIHPRLWIKITETIYQYLVVVVPVVPQWPHCLCRLLCEADRKWMPLLPHNANCAFTVLGSGEDHRLPCDQLPVRSARVQGHGALRHQRGT